MNIAEEHFNKLSESETFRKAYIEESIKLDLELRLDALKADVKLNKSRSTILKKLRGLENLVKEDFHLKYVR
jgi:hypothetical protein